HELARILAQLKNTKAFLKVGRAVPIAPVEVVKAFASWVQLDASRGALGTARRTAEGFGQCALRMRRVLPDIDNLTSRPHYRPSPPGPFVRRRSGRLLNQSPNTSYALKKTLCTHLRFHARHFGGNCFRAC